MKTLTRASRAYDGAVLGFKSQFHRAPLGLRSAAETLSVIERQRIVRLLVKEVLVGEDTTIRHSIPIPSGPLKTAARSQKAQITFCVRGVISPLLSNIYLR